MAARSSIVCPTDPHDSPRLAGRKRWIRVSFEYRDGEWIELDVPPDCSFESFCREIDSSLPWPDSLESFEELQQPLTWRYKLFYKTKAGTNALLSSDGTLRTAFAEHAEQLRIYLKPKFFDSAECTASSVISTLLSFRVPSPFFTSAELFADAARTAPKDAAQEARLRQLWDDSAAAAGQPPVEQPAGRGKAADSAAQQAPNGATSAGRGSASTRRKNRRSNRRRGGLWWEDGEQAADDNGDAAPSSRRPASAWNDDAAAVQALVPVVAVANAWAADSSDSEDVKEAWDADSDEETPKKKPAKHSEPAAVTAPKQQPGEAKKKPVLCKKKKRRAKREEQKRREEEEKKRSPQSQPESTGDGAAAAANTDSNGSADDNDNDNDNDHGNDDDSKAAAAGNGQLAAPSPKQADDFVEFAIAVISVAPPVEPQADVQVDAANNSNGQITSSSDRAHSVEDALAEEIAALRTLSSADAEDPLVLLAHIYDKLKVFFAHKQAP